MKYKYTTDNKPLADAETFDVPSSIKDEKTIVSYAAHKETLKGEDFPWAGVTTFTLWDDHDNLIGSYDVTTEFVTQYVVEKVR